MNPNRSPGEIARIVDTHQHATALVHPQRVIASMRRDASEFSRANNWLADHIVAVAGTMIFFYFLCGLLGIWVLWQSAIEGDNGFDPFPYSFLFFILGGIMQSLFVPTMLTTSNRAALRDQIKDESDHRAWSHLYAVNDRQLDLLEQIAKQVLGNEYVGPPGEVA